MVTRIISMIILLLNCLQSVAQESAEDIHKDHRYGVFAYKGVPNIMNIVDEEFGEYDVRLDQGYRGPYGMVLYRKAGPHMNLLLDVNYTKNWTHLLHQSRFYSGTTPVILGSYFKVHTRIRFMPGLEFVGHAGRWEFTAGIRAGYIYHNKVEVFTSMRRPTRVYHNRDEIFGTLLPITMRVNAGVKYFIEDQLGLSLELGAGGGAICNFGVLYKFDFN